MYAPPAFREKDTVIMHAAMRAAGLAVLVTVTHGEPVASQLKGIVGVTLRIDRLEGSWKLSQNRPPADRAGVIAGLADEPGAERLLAAMVRPGQP